MARFFVEVETPKYCLLTEAVQFLALGRVPEAHWKFESTGPDSKDRDARFTWDSLPDYLANSLDWLFLHDFEHAGISMPHNYPEIVESYHVGEIADALTTIEVYEKGSHFFKGQLKEKIQKKLNACP